MLIPLLRLLLSFSHPSDAAHELAHRACEIAVYDVVSPDVPDDATTVLGEWLAEILCRGDGA